MKTNDLSKQSMPAVVIFNPNHPQGLSVAAAAITEAVSSYRGVSSSQPLHQARGSRTLFQDVSPNSSVRNEFGRSDYEAFRPGEAVPIHPKDIMSFANQAYRRVGLVRNIVDLMGDFTVQGIKIVHPNKTQQRLYRAWWKKVKGKHVSERFSNLLYRLGNPVVRRWTAKLPQTAERKMVAMGAILDVEEEMPDALRTRSRVIPSRYNFLNPMTLVIPGGELGQFVGEKIIALALPERLKNQILHPRDELEKALVAKIPQDIKDAAKSGKRFVILPNEKIIISHYKKDDWQTWADPIAYAAMDDLILLEKMKLADLAALDGAISQVRLWTLGDLDKGIIPTDAAISKLADILLSNPGGGSFDIIWGPDLKVQNYETEVHKFLGSEKYEPVLNSLYETFGVPGTLTGSQAGTTNNLISMETLIQRLNYGRDVLTEFWDGEIELFRQAMGLKKGAKIVYDHMTLSDKTAEKAILKDLWDRDLISDETLLERLGEDDALELLRKRRENKERKNKTRTAKAGPYFQPEKMHDYIKLALNKGYIGPGDAGIEDLSDEPSPFEQQMDMMLKKQAMMGQGKDPSTKSPGSPGRPKNVKDGPEGRKTRVFKTAAESIDETAWLLTRMSWSKQAQEQIAEIINPGVLAHYGKKTMRGLSKEAAASTERVKFRILAGFQPFDTITKEAISRITAENKPIHPLLDKCCSAFESQLRHNNGREPNTEEMRSIQAAAYSLLYEQL